HAHRRRSARATGSDGQLPRRQCGHASRHDVDAVGARGSRRVDRVAALSMTEIGPLSPPGSPSVPKYRICADRPTNWSVGGDAMPDHGPGTARVDAGARAERLDRAVVQGVEVIREGRIEPFLSARPALSSTAIRWGGLAVEDYRIPACVIPAHEHLHDFVHVVL